MRWLTLALAAILSACAHAPELPSVTLPLPAFAATTEWVDIANHEAANIKITADRPVAGPVDIARGQVLRAVRDGDGYRTSLRSAP